MRHDNSIPVYLQLQHGLDVVKIFLGLHKRKRSPTDPLCQLSKDLA